MYNRRPNGPVPEAVREILEPRGYYLVAFSSEVVNRRMQVRCVVHHPDGVGLEALSEIHRALEPRLELLLEHRDLNVEFSSPGIGRTLASFHEFEIFRYQSVAVLPTDADDWIHGTIIAADADSCLIRDARGAERSFSPEAISKARLTE